jgi:environmental stress-induced protein Ves
MNAKLRLLTQEDYATSRWGGGSTTQLAVAPQDARYERRDFLWRVSSASVELEESEFTPLPDYERLICAISGQMQLSHNGAPYLPLAPGQVHRFDGAAQTHCRGKVTDFNLMLRKGQCQGEMWAVRVQENGTRAHSIQVQPGQEVTVLLYCTQGSGQIFCGEETRTIHPGQCGMLVLRDPGTVTLSGTTAATFLAAEIRANLKANLKED